MRLPVIAAKDDVSFEEFTRMDIRTATILEAEKVPKTTKLIKLKVDTGIDVRTIVSGIAEQFTAEELPGKEHLRDCQPRSANHQGDRIEGNGSAG